MLLLWKTVRVGERALKTRFAGNIAWVEGSARAWAWIHQCSGRIIPFTRSRQGCNVEGVAMYRCLVKHCSGHLLLPSWTCLERREFVQSNHEAGVHVSRHGPDRTNRAYCGASRRVLPSQRHLPEASSCVQHCHSTSSLFKHSEGG